MSTTATRVGPVLEATERGLAVATAIEQANPGTKIEDHGSYLRVLAPAPCEVSRSAIERQLEGDFRFPSDLERLMPSFRGFLHVEPDRVRWSNTP